MTQSSLRSLPFVHIPLIFHFARSFFIPFCMSNEKRARLKRVKTISGNSLSLNSWRLCRVNYEKLFSPHYLPKKIQFHDFAYIFRASSEPNVHNFTLLPLILVAIPRGWMEIYAHNDSTFFIQSCTFFAFLSDLHRTVRGKTVAVNGSMAHR